MLRQIGPRLRPCLRDGDTLARLGGDEFAVLLPRLADHHLAATVAGRIVDRIGRPFSIDRLTLEIGVSIRSCRSTSSRSTARSSRRWPRTATLPSSCAR
jgi:GGDEF domain-containing protein